MNSSKPSGTYKCTNCDDQKTTHVEGKSFAPCSKCNKNDWKMVKESK